MIRRKKWLELMKYFFNNEFEHTWLKHAFEFKYYKIWKCGHNKKNSYLCDRRHECIIYII